jgi:hypothetical protein
LSNGVGCEAKIFWGRTSKEHAGPTPVKRGTSRQNFGSTLKNKLMAGCDAKLGTFWFINPVGPTGPTSINRADNILD